MKCFGLPVLLATSLLSLTHGSVSLISGASPEQTNTKLSSFWTTAAGYESTIFLYNTSRSETITVRPTLNGSLNSTIELDDIILKPNGSGLVSVNTALSRKGLGPQRGAARFEYKSRYKNILLVETQVVSLWHQIGYTIPSQEFLSDANAIHTVAVVPSPGSQFELAVYNASDSPMPVTASLRSLKGQLKLPSALVQPQSAHVFRYSKKDSLVDHSVVDWNAGSAVGITVDCGGKACRVVPSAWFADETEHLLNRSLVSRHAG